MALVAGEGEVLDEFVADDRPARRFEQADHLGGRGAVGAGQAGAVYGVHAGFVTAGEGLDDLCPAPVRPGAAEAGASSFISISAKKLSE